MIKGIIGAIIFFIILNESNTILNSKFLIFLLVISIVFLLLFF